MMRENTGDLERQVLKVLITTAQQAQVFDPESIDYSVALDELSDCTFLLERGCDNDAVRKILESTTSGELHNILSQRKLPTKTYTVTIEEHISGELTVCADSPSEAENVAKLKYGRGEFVVEHGTPTCRLMMVMDNETEHSTEWREF